MTTVTDKHHTTDVVKTYNHDVVKDIDPVSQLIDVVKTYNNDDIQS